MFTFLDMSTSDTLLTLDSKSGSVVYCPHPVPVFHMFYIHNFMARLKQSFYKDTYRRLYSRLQHSWTHSNTFHGYVKTSWRRSWNFLKAPFLTGTDIRSLLGPNQTFHYSRTNSVSGYLYIHVGYYRQKY